MCIPKCIITHLITSTIYLTGLISLNEQLNFNKTLAKSNMFYNFIVIYHFTNSVIWAAKLKFVVLIVV